MKEQNLIYIAIIALVLVAIFLIVHKTSKVKFELRTMIVVSLMSLLSMVLAVYSLMIPLFGFPSLKFGFSQLPIMITGALFGPWWGMVGGVLEDLLELASGTISTPYLGFTLNKALIGIIPGLVFILANKQPKKMKTYITTFVGILYSCSIIFILTTDSVTAAQVTYMLSWPIKAILIALTLAILPLSYLIMKLLKFKDVDQRNLQAWLLSVIMIEILVNVILTPIWLENMYGIPFVVQVVIRSVKASFFVVLNTFLAYFVHQNLKRLKR